jgi:signal transduction histidine kinase
MSDAPVAGDEATPSSGGATRAPAGWAMACIAVLAAVGAAALDVAWPGPAPLPIAAGAILLALSWRRVPRALAVMVALALAGAATARVHVRVLERGWVRDTPARVASRLEAVEARKEQLVGQVASAADRVAALPDSRAALAGDREALRRLFVELDSLGDLEGRPALAVHALPLTTVAWAGRSADLRGVQATGAERRVFVLSGTVHTRLVATTPIRSPAGHVVGLASADIPVKVRRNIENQYLSDFDLLAGAAPGLEVRYQDVRGERESGRPLPGPPPVADARDAVLRGPDGSVLALVRATSGGPDEAVRDLRARYRRSLSGLAVAATLLWIVTARRFLAWPAALALGATALRGLLLLLGPPLPSPSSRLLSAETYASTLMGPLLRSPLDFLLTAAWAAVVSALVVHWRLRRAPREPSAGRSFVSAVAALPLIASAFAWIADTSSNCSLDLEAIALVPRSAAHLVLQTSLLLVLAAASGLLVALFTWAGPLPRSRSGRLGRAALWAGLGAVAFQFWPRDLIGLPLLPAVALFVGAATVGGTADVLRDRLASAGAGVRAGVVIAGVAVFALLLYPSLIHYGEKSTRAQIERDHAPLVLRQPQWREYVLSESRQRIDALNVLEDQPEAPFPLGLEELAFAVWSATDLAGFGLSSAVEIQDPSGVVISRFALNLPSLGPSPFPERESWDVSNEPHTVASARRRVLHARRRLTYHGELHGAIHVYVGDDFWNLPFLAGRDPYSVLFRPTPKRPARVPDLGLVVYEHAPGGAVLFSSADRPPPLTPALVERLRESPSGLWTTLPVDGRPHHVFLFADREAAYGLAYPRLEAARFAADLVEAASGLSFAAVASLAVVVLLRTALGRRRLSVASILRAVERRFALRLFVAFVAIAVVPLAVLQVVVRGFVVERLTRESEDQALERAAVAKKTVDDFAFFQRGESPEDQPVTDAALVWVASVIRNDLDVFDRGRLLASSERELYDSGLLPPRVSGPVFSTLILEGLPSALRTERIGEFSYLVASVPVQLDAPEPGILSIPLPLRQREVQAALTDLDRKIRLASTVFLLAAAGLALSISRRISGPIGDLTRATRDVARGDLAARVETTSRDELRQLVDAFNQMAGDLDRQRRDLERSNRLAAWAEMARQVAHEVKNPLTPIQLSAEHLRRVFRDGDADFGRTLEACTDTILKQVRTLRGIVTEFSAFARPAGELELQQLPAIVQSALRPYQAALPPGVTLVVEMSRDVPPVRGDRRLLERAVVNLVENALQAVGDRGTIAVRVRRGEGGRIEAEVEDSGPGIEPELRDRVFEPFFSTKTSGSGLGLALVKKIAEDHGGGASLATGPPTRALLWIPAASAVSTPSGESRLGASGP